MKRATTLDRIVYFWDAVNERVHRYCAKPLTNRDAQDIARYKNALADKEKAGDIDTVAMLSLANYPLFRGACASYCRVPYSGEEEPTREEVLNMDFGEPIELTEDEFLDLAESFSFGILDAIYDQNPDRKFEFDLLKKIMQSLPDSFAEILQTSLQPPSESETPIESGSDSK